jgi:hypothetical protein
VSPNDNGVDHLVVKRLVSLVNPAERALTRKFVEPDAHLPRTFRHRKLKVTDRGLIDADVFDLIAVEAS